ncbi:hypothetical protein STAS_02625, partial [Striga asiatica]
AKPIDAENLVHPPNEFINVIFPITGITTLNIMVPLLLQSTQRSLQLEWPQEVVSFLEVGSHSQNLMNKILHADNAMLAQSLLQNNHMFVAILPISDIRLNPVQHVHCGFVYFQEDTIEDLYECQLETKLIKYMR